MAYFIYFMLVFSSIFQDFFLVNIIGEFGRSITSIIVIPLFIMYFLFSKKKIGINRNIKILLYLAVYLLFINILNLAKYLIIDVGSLNILDENVLGQTIKGYIYFFNITIFMVLMYNLQSKLTKERLFKPFVFTYLFLFFILLIEIVTIPNALPFLHNSTLYYRVRLTTSESSWTSSIIVVFFVVTYYYYNNIKCSNIMKKFSIVIFLLFLINSQSKGLIINVLLAILIIIIIERKLSMKFIGIIIIIAIGSIFIPVIKESIVNDLENYTSIVTRTYSIIIGALFSIINPFGTGNALYLVEYPIMLEKYIGLFNNIEFNFNLNEIYSYINATTSQSISAKSSFIQYGMYWGIVGTIIIVLFLINIYRDMFKNKKDEFIIFKFGYISIILLLFTTITWDIKYEIWSFLSLMIYMGSYNKDVNDSIRRKE